jgi:hypothetical protein
MISISKKAKNCLKKVVEWGGVASVVVLFACEQTAEAFIVAIVFGVLVVILDEYFTNLP